MRYYFEYFVHNSNKGKQEIVIEASNDRKAKLMFFDKIGTNCFYTYTREDGEMHTGCDDETERLMIKNGQ